MSIYPVPLTGTVNTLMWADEAGIEEAAIRQLRNTSTLPWTHGLRVMPDVHYGKGATVGIRHRDAPGGSSRRGRCRHRLRHDRGTHQPQAQPAPR